MQDPVARPGKRAKPPSKEKKVLTGSKFQNRNGQVSVGVAVATYKRPANLKALLESLTEITLPDGVSLSIAVADNDIAQSAKEIVAEANISSPHKIAYSLQPEPGIAHTRNKTVSMLQECDFVAFVDDDEWVHESWLAELLKAQNRFDADIVHGPVEYIFTSKPSDWMVSGGFYIAETQQEGTKLPFAATNNLLVRGETLRTMGSNPFDLRFSLTGGSDTMLTSTLSRKGASIVWTNRAVVYENVPPERITKTWVFKRAIRTGNTLSRVRIYSNDTQIERAAVLFSGVARIASAVPIALVSIPIPRLRGVAIRRFARGLGMMGGLFRMSITEYKRNKDAI